MRASKRYLSAVVAVAVVALQAVGLAGCGGGSAASGPPPPAKRVEQGTARFQVDVATGQVGITSLTGRPASRAVFNGSAVSFQSSTLLDQPGNTGIRVLKVAVKNELGVSIGPDGYASTDALRVLFGPITNLDGPSGDLSDQVQVSALTGGQSGIRGLAVDASGTVFYTVPGLNSIYAVRHGSARVYAGTGASGAADGLVGATFRVPQGVALDAADGALFVADTGNNKVRRIASDGQVTTVAGTGLAGGQDGSGTTATFDSPMAIAVAAPGDLYVTCTGDSKLRRLQLVPGTGGQPDQWMVSTVATGLSGPTGVACLASGQLVVCEYNANRLRLVAANGESAIIAGAAAAGDANGSGSVARFRQPRNVAWVAGGLVVAEAGGNRLRWVTHQTGTALAQPDNWQVAALAGSTTGVAGSEVGLGSVARFDQPCCVAGTGNGPVIVSETSTPNLRRVELPSSLLTSSRASSTRASSEPVRLTNASDTYPGANGVAVPYVSYAGAGEVGVPTRSRLAPGATTPAKEWWFSVPDGVQAFSFVVTVEAQTAGLAPPDAGSGAPGAAVSAQTILGRAGSPGLVDGPASAARMGQSSVGCDSRGNLYLADRTSHCVRRFDRATGQVTTIAGWPGVSGTQPGYGTNARLVAPSSLAVADDDTLFVVQDSTNQVVRIGCMPWRDRTDPASWYTSVIVGTGNYGLTTGQGNVAELAAPFGVAAVGPKSIVISERGGNRLRRATYVSGEAGVPNSWEVSYLAGDTTAATGVPGTTDGTGAAARFNQPTWLAVDASGTVVVSDSANVRLRKVTLDGEVTTLAGPTGAVATGYADGTGPTARFQSVNGVCLDTAGYAYVVDAGNARLRRVSPTGLVTTVTGDGTLGVVDGFGAQIRLGSPAALSIDGSGTLYLNDGASIRAINRVISSAQ